MKTPLAISTMSLILTALLNGCATQQQPAQTSKGADLIERALAREARLSGDYSIMAEDRFFSARVMASGQPSIKSHDNLYQITVPIGADTDAECFVYHEAMDSAGTLAQFFGTPLEGMAKTHNLKIDAGLFGELPYLYHERLYLTEDRTAGVLKAIVVPYESTLLACMHDAAGYSETFRSMVAGLAKSLVLRDEQYENVMHKEVFLWQLGELNIGFTINRAVMDAEGDIKSTVESGVILPRSENSVMTRDEYSIIFERPNGEMINAQYAESEDGEMVMSIRLDPAETQGYQVSGTLEGKTIAGPLRGALPIVGPYFQHRSLLQAAHAGQQGPQSVNMDVYIPSARPLETLTIDMHPTGARTADNPEYELEFSEVKARMVVDPQGVQSMRLDMGPADIQLQRAYVNSRS